MADRRRALAAAALGLSLLLTGCSDGDEDTGEGPSGTNSSSASPEPSGTSGPSETSSAPTSGSASAACDAIDASALSAETGVKVTEPSTAGTPGKRESCALTFADYSVLRIDLTPGHGTLEQDVEQAKVLGTEVPQEVTVAGAPGLMVSDGGQVTRVGLVTHVGERLLLVTLNHFESGGKLVEQMESLVLASAEQVAAGAA
ncbi:DUF3558 domain-containing protein [Nocardioides sp. cx-169]|uniref:DUF3558 family protein n=1 Tax=Nocardioides sp. cx-169 TaxID=2899080 RepID=UPI001E51BA97|nr:DUF3558 family protein [Nocardioides sp. cx-169]MCD4535692.1 DUF3558 domain-containing protein [Nocardioides sp. cx-169]